MSDIGYYEPVPGIYGTPNPATDPTPESRAALQERYAALQRERTATPGYIPPSYINQGNGNLPKIGWTAQNGSGSAFPPFIPRGAAAVPYPSIGGIAGASGPSIGHIPDWDLDPNPIAAGSYDMNQAVAAYPVNMLNRAPIGELDALPLDVPNPNAPTTDVGGTIDLEW